MDSVLINYCLGRELLSLPGIGERFADEILRIRQEKGNTELEDLRSIRGLRVTDELIDLIDFRPYEPSIKEAQTDIKKQNIQYASPVNRSTFSNESNRVPFHFNPNVPPPMTHYPPQKNRCLWCLWQSLICRARTEILQLVLSSKWGQRLVRCQPQTGLGRRQRQYSSPHTQACNCSKAYQL